YGLFLMQWGFVGAFLFALLAVLVMRGILSWIRRSLVLHESIADYDDQDRRTLETNRYIFWRRACFLIALAILYFGGAIALGISPGQALAMLPVLLLSAIPAVGYFILIFLAQF